ncbi:MAG: glycosyltransferase family 39 protein [Pseudomonadota bacterium]
MKKFLRDEMFGMPRWVWGILLFTLCMQYILSARLELSFDEAYYWLWAKNLQLSYYDHPPMVALLIAASTSVFGNAEWAVRFFSPLMQCGAALLLAKAVQDFGGDKKAQIMAALFLPVTILGYVLFITTPDTPLMFFATLMLFTLARFYKTQNRNWWLAIGAAGGLALLSKYTAIMLFAGVFIWLVSSPRRRNEFRQLKLWAGLLLSAIIFSPVLIWNLQNGGASFFKQAGRFDFLSVWTRFMLDDFLAGQVILITPLLLALVVYATVLQFKKMRTGESRAVLLCALALPTILIIGLLSCLRKVEANWALISLPPLIVMTALSASEKWPEMKNFTRVAFASGGALVACMLLYLFIPFSHSYVNVDISQRLSGHRRVADNLAKFAEKSNACLVVTADYATNALMAYYLHGRYDVVQITQSERYTSWQRPDMKDCFGRNVLAVSQIKHANAENEFRAALGNLEQLAVLRRAHRGVYVQDYNLFEAKLALVP